MFPEQRKEQRERKGKQSNGIESLPDKCSLCSEMNMLVGDLLLSYLHAVLCLAKGTKINVASCHCPLKLGLAPQHFTTVLSEFEIHFLIFKMQSKFLK